MFITLPGELVKPVSDDGFSDVCQYAGLIYAVTYGEPIILVYDPRIWNRIRVIKPEACQCSPCVWHSLRVTSRGLTLECRGNDCVYVLNHDGTVQHTHGETGDGAGEFNVPFLCSVESDGSMLVADLSNNRLQV